jgi:hypothetical protein
MNANIGTKKVEKDATNTNEYEIPVGECFKLNAKKKLGSGAFGDIYYGKFYYSNFIRYQHPYV